MTTFPGCALRQGWALLIVLGLCAAGGCSLIQKAPEPVVPETTKTPPAVESSIPPEPEEIPTATGKTKSEGRFDCGSQIPPDRRGIVVWTKFSRQNHRKRRTLRSASNDGRPCEPPFWQQGKSD